VNCSPQVAESLELRSRLSEIISMTRLRVLGLAPAKGKQTQV